MNVKEANVNVNNMGGPNLELVPYMETEKPVNDGGVQMPPTANPSDENIEKTSCQNTDKYHHPALRDGDKIKQNKSKLANKWELALQKQREMSEKNVASLAVAVMESLKTARSCLGDLQGGPGKGVSASQQRGAVVHGVEGREPEEEGGGSSNANVSGSLKEGKGIHNYFAFIGSLRVCFFVGSVSVCSL